MGGASELQDRSTAVASLQASLSRQSAARYRVGERGVVAFVLVGVVLGELGECAIEARRCRRGRRRWRSGHPSGRGRGRASIRTSGRRSPSLPESSSRRSPIPSSPAAGGRRSRARRRRRPSSAASRGRCRWRPASGAGRPRLARRDPRSRSCPVNSSSTEACASLICRNSGSCSSRPSNSAIQHACRRSRRRRPCGRCRPSGTARAARGGRSATNVDTRARTRAADAVTSAADSDADSSTGTISGGSLMIRGSPSTRWVSLANALQAVVGARLGHVMLHLLCAPLVVEFSTTLVEQPLDVRCRAYQTSRFGISREARASPRGSCATVGGTILVTLLSEKPLPRPATARLAANRFTSHSHGPGSVSSKSLTSKISRRPGEANAPKLDRWASPHACTTSPGPGRRRQVRGHRPAQPRDRT